MEKFNGSPLRMVGQTDPDVNWTIQDITLFSMYERTILRNASVDLDQYF